MLENGWQLLKAASVVLQREMLAHFPFFSEPIPVVLFFSCCCLMAWLQFSF
jgi:hypothetical protein